MSASFPYTARMPLTRATLVTAAAAFLVGLWAFHSLGVIGMLLAGVGCAAITFGICSMLSTRHAAQRTNNVDAPARRYRQQVVAQLAKTGLTVVTEDSVPSSDDVTRSDVICQDAQGVIGIYTVSTGTGPSSVRVTRT